MTNSTSQPLRRADGGAALFSPRHRNGPWPYALITRAGCALSYRFETAVRVATAFVSHTLSAAHFTCGIDPTRFYEEYFAWQLAFRSLEPGLAVEMDLQSRETTTQAYGLARQSVRFLGDLGTVGLHDSAIPQIPAPAPLPRAEREPDAMLHTAASPPAGEAADPALAAVLKSVTAPTGPVGGRTKGLVVVRDGAVVAEAYAPGYGPDTPIIGFSLTKTLANAVTGRMVELGHLDLDQPGICEEWRGASDPRRAITANHLLRMTSGLKLPETHTGFDPVSQMLFLSGDMAGFAARAPLVSAPGTRFAYTSGSTLLLSRLIRDKLGGNPLDTWRFLDREIFAPLGIEHAHVDFDASGTPILSTFCYATARDWARLGMLYLNDGCAGSRRLLPQGWVRAATTGTVEPSYGAALRVSCPGAEGDKWILPGMPEGTFYSHGHLGQYVVVIPAWNAVIVRLGASAQSQRGRDRKLLGAVARAVRP